MTSETRRTPSLGEVAYLAYWRRWPALPLAWETLPRREQRAWEAAAQGAIAAWLTQREANGRIN